VRETIDHQSLPSIIIQPCPFAVVPAKASRASVVESVMSDP
jgi:hypothetical protein